MDDNNNNKKKNKNKSIFFFKPLPGEEKKEDMFVRSLHIVPAARSSEDTMT